MDTATRLTPSTFRHNGSMSDDPVVPDIGPDVVPDAVRWAFVIVFVVFTLVLYLVFMTVMVWSYRQLDSKPVRIAWAAFQQKEFQQRLNATDEEEEERGTNAAALKKLRQESVDKVVSQDSVEKTPAATPEKIPVVRPPPRASRPSLTHQDAIPEVVEPRERPKMHHSRSAEMSERLHELEQLDRGTLEQKLRWTLKSPNNLVLSKSAVVIDVSGLCSQRETCAATKEAFALARVLKKPALSVIVSNPSHVAGEKRNKRANRASRAAILNLGKQLGWDMALPAEKRDVRRMPVVRVVIPGGYLADREFPMRVKVPSPVPVRRNQFVHFV